MKFFIFLLFLVFLMGNILAFEFSPTQIDMNLEKNQQDCKTITLTSDSDTIQIYDKWAENKDLDWNVNLFRTEASSQGLSLTYPSELLLKQREFQVCISGSKEGEYHGVLLLKEEQKGNSIMQMAIWLKIRIGNVANQQTTQQNTPSTNAGTENSGKVALQVQKQETAKTTTETIKETDKTTTSGITGAAVGTNNSGAGKSILIIIIILVALGGFIALFNYKRLQKRRMEYGY